MNLMRRRREMMKMKPYWDYILLPNEDGRIPAKNIYLNGDVGDTTTFVIEYSATKTTNVFAGCVYSTANTSMGSPQHLGATIGVHSVTKTVTKQSIYMGDRIVFSGWYSYSDGTMNRAMYGDYIKIHVE